MLTLEQSILPYVRPLEPWLLRDDVTDICVTGERIHVDDGEGLKLVDARFESDEDLASAVKIIARQIGNDISEESPLLDARLADGSRVAAILHPVSRLGTTLTIRKFNRSLDGQRLVELKFISRELLDELELSVRQERANILISGGTGSGKTTLANALLSQVDPAERVIVIEDTTEMNLDALPHVVKLEARKAQQDLPAVTLRELLRATMRHVPDRIILGEFRGPEAYELLELLNTGHRGTVSTLHANSAIHALRRFANCVKQCEVDLPYTVVRTQIGETVDLVIHTGRPQGERRVLEVIRIHGYDPVTDCYRYEALT